MGSRSEARERALELLYEAHMKGEDPTAIMAALPVAVDPFTRVLVEGVLASRSELDHAIEARLRDDWSLDRLGIIDRLILQLGAWELAHTDTPSGVVLSEAVEMAGRYGSDTSAAFVNGVLARIAD